MFFFFFFWLLLSKFLPILAKDKLGDIFFKGKFCKKIEVSNLYTYTNSYTYKYIQIYIYSGMGFSVFP